VRSFLEIIGSVFTLMARRKLFSYVGHGSGMAVQLGWKQARSRGQEFCPPSFSDGKFPKTFGPRLAETTKVVHVLFLLSTSYSSSSIGFRAIETCSSRVLSYSMRRCHDRDCQERRSVREINATKRGSGSCSDSTSPLVSGRGISTCLKRGIPTAGRQLLV
jgi:hypothetical protein